MSRQLLTKGEPRAALVQLEKGFLTCQPTAAELVLKGQLEYLLALNEAAGRTFRQAVELDPMSEEPRYALGRYLAQLQLHEQAIEQFQMITASHPNAYRAWDNMGVSLEALGREDEAAAAYARGIALVDKDHPEYDWPYANLASLLINRGESRRAFDLAVAAAERNPSSARNFYLAAKALTRLDQWEKSVRWLQRSAELDPRYPEPRYLLGQVFRRLSRLEESAREFAMFEKLRAEQPARRR